jgi:hypothetical protein
MSTKVLFLTSANTGAWTVPSDFGSLISIEGIGAGGSAPLVSAGGSANIVGGGGGGAYAKSTSVSGLYAGGTTYVSVGNGANSSNTTGADTWFNVSSNSAPTLSTQGILAAGGNPGIKGGTAGAGGSSVNSIGDLKYSGGTGGNGFYGVYLSAYAETYSGGGGGAAGPGGVGGNGGTTLTAGLAAAAGGGGAGTTAAGGNANGATAGTGGSTGGGAGGIGAYNNANPLAGSNGSIWTSFSGQTAGPGGGGGAGGTTAGSGSQPGANGGSYGGGAAGGYGTSGTSGAGIIIFTYNSLLPNTITANTTTVDEGNTVSFTFTASQLTGISNGTTLYWNTLGTANSSIRFADSQNTGSFTVTSNTGSFTRQILADGITEGNTYFVIQITTDSGHTLPIANSANVYINDTSNAITYYTVTSNTSTVNEGNTVLFTVNALNAGVPNGNTLYYTISGNVANSQLANSGYGGSIVMNSNTGTFVQTTVADLQTEGTRYFNIKLYSDSANTQLLTTSANVTINDTSISPFTPVYTSNATHNLSNTGILQTKTLFDETTNNQFIKFNGSTDYLSVANTNIGSLSGKPFTIEAFIYPTNYSAGYTSQYSSEIFSTQNASGAAFEFGIKGTASSYTGIYIYANSGATVNSTFNYNFSLNTWYHVALTRTSAGVFTIYVNGNSVGTVTNAGSWSDKTPYNIGRSNFTGYNYYFPGLISNFRLNIGTPLYSANFAPPTSALTNVANTKLLLCTEDFPYIDLSSSNNTITFNGTTLIQNYSPFNDNELASFNTNSINGSLTETDFLDQNFGSLKFDGSSGHLTVANTNIGGLVGKPFTIESFVYLTGYSSLYGSYYVGEIFSTTSTTAANGGNYGIQFGISGTASSYTNISLYVNNGTINSNFSYAFQLNTWYHIALTRTSAGVWTVYVNGNSIGSVTNTTTWIDNNPYGIAWNASTGYQYYLNGLMTNFRLNIGTPLYSANFAPPTLALTNVANTQLLLDAYPLNPFGDTSSNNNTIVISGNVSPNTLTPYVRSFNNSSSKMQLLNNGTIKVDTEFDEFNTYAVNLLNQADFRISSVDSLATYANNTTLSSMPNLGTNTSFVITAGTSAPTRSTYNNYPIIKFTTIPATTLNISTPINVTTSNGTFLFVGRGTSTSRMIALGGANASGNGSCFFGWTGTGDTGAMFRNSSDAGVTSTAITDNNGLGVVAVTKNGGTGTLFVNSSLIFSITTGLTGNFVFQKIGARDYTGVYNGQASDGVLCEVIYYSRILTNDEISALIGLLKSKYGIV